MALDFASATDMPYDDAVVMDEGTEKRLMDLTDIYFIGPH